MKYETQDYWNGLIKMSLSRFFILHVLNRNPVHGYEITKQVSSITQGCCAPTEGSLYPVLKEFVDAGLIDGASEVVAGRERKVYTLTTAGKQAYLVASKAWGAAAAYILSAISQGDPRAAQETGADQDRHEGSAPDDPVDTECDLKLKLTPNQ